MSCTRRRREQGTNRKRGKGRHGRQAHQNRQSAEKTAQGPITQVRAADVRSCTQSPAECRQQQQGGWAYVEGESRIRPCKRRKGIDKACNCGAAKRVAQIEA